MVAIKFKNYDIIMFIIMSLQSVKHTYKFIQHKCSIATKISNFVNKYTFRSQKQTRKRQR